MSHFFCRLVAPRTTFPADMTPEEAELMGRHAGFWAEQAEARRAVIVGPVADPAGFWGLVVLDVPDEAAARAILSEDPVTAGGSAFRYDLFSMPQVILRDSHPAV